MFTSDEVRDSTPIIFACNDIRPTFFNQQQFAWGFGIQNTTPNTIPVWSVQFRNANYRLDPTRLTNQGAFTYSEVDNGDGTYDLTLIGTMPIPPFGGIPGGNIAWNGVNFGFRPTSNGLDEFCGLPPTPSEPTLFVITNRRITYRVKNN